MMRLIAIFFAPPPMPPMDIPVAARLLPHVKMTIQKAFEFAYYRGAFDGFVVGVLVALLFIPHLRQKAVKGASHVVDQF